MRALFSPPPLIQPRMRYHPRLNKQLLSFARGRCRPHLTQLAYISSILTTSDSTTARSYRSTDVFAAGSPERARPFLPAHSRAQRTTDGRKQPHRQLFRAIIAPSLTRQLPTRATPRCAASCEQRKHAHRTWHCITGICLFHQRGLSTSVQPLTSLLAAPLLMWFASVIALFALYHTLV